MTQKETEESINKYYFCKECGNKDPTRFQEVAWEGQMICLGAKGRTCGVVVKSNIAEKGQAFRNFKDKADRNTNGKYSKRRRSNVAVIIVSIVFISSFLFYCLLLNHSFPTNPNKITNCFKLILSVTTLQTTLLLRRYFDF